MNNLDIFFISTLGYICIPKDINLKECLGLIPLNKFFKSINLFLKICLVYILANYILFILKYSDGNLDIDKISNLSNYLLSPVLNYLILPLSLRFIISGMYSYLSNLDFYIKTLGFRLCILNVFICISLVFLRLVAYKFGDFSKYVSYLAVILLLPSTFATFFTYCTWKTPKNS